MRGSIVFRIQLPDLHVHSDVVFEYIELFLGLLPYLSVFVLEDPCCESLQCLSCTCKFHISEPYGFTDDSDWAADVDNRKSTCAYLFLLDGASCSWKVKLSSTVCLSTQQAEYYALSEGTKEALNLRFLLRDLGFGQTLPTLLFCDNKGAITMALHPANKPASRHIDMRIHFCRQHVELGDIVTTFAPTPDMVADFMTKQTQRQTHERHCRRAFGNQHAPIPLEPIVRMLV